MPNLVIIELCSVHVLGLGPFNKKVQIWICIFCNEIYFIYSLSSSLFLLTKPYFALNVFFSSTYKRIVYDYSCHINDPCYIRCYNTYMIQIVIIIIIHKGILPSDVDSNYKVVSKWNSFLKTHSKLINLLNIIDDFK